MTIFKTLNGERRTGNTSENASGNALRNVSGNSSGNPSGNAVENASENVSEGVLGNVSRNPKFLCVLIKKSCRAVLFQKSIRVLN